MVITEKIVLDSYNGITFGEYSESSELVLFKEDLKTIFESNIDLELKYGIFNRLEDINTSPESYDDVDEFMEDIIENGFIICDMDSCLGTFESITGVSGEDEEEEVIVNVLRRNFMDNLGKLNYKICTEDYFEIV